jgi:orotate phosphoribosyltransferase
LGETPSTPALLPYQIEFIELAIANRVLQFGSYQLKSGRISPYFFNAGFFCGGQSQALLCRSYAQAIKASGLEFDVIFGPAYKGIPLAAGVATAWYELYREDKVFAYNRKEKKDHGEVSCPFLHSADDDREAPLLAVALMEREY